MEVVIPTMDFDFNSARASPCSTTPSTPKRFGEYYFSAPTTLHRSHSIGKKKPGTPKSDAKFEDDFAFDFSEELEKSMIPAEELFDGGKIRPLKPPPVLQRSRFGVSEASKSSIASPKSPISQIRGALSPRKKKSSPKSPIEDTHQRTERGRERVNSLSSSSSRRGTRSQSPYRVSTYPWEEEQNRQNQTTNQPNSIIPKPSLSSTTSSLSSSSKSDSKKWRLKDFFLFRSASEGRASDKDPLKKYSAVFRKIRRCEVFELQID
ncbi:calmodulin-binding protein [Actinidia rufa]|uniref:Calmodulin-binding protein n=1 Tax=Actinidia rufa TaxID=165716 RepID=A0A7J0DEE6_9ERIC|nr:calmodulin-binding protein [Actinidia rufa]